MEVSIVIVNYNGGRLLCDCLSSIYKHCLDIDFKVTVFDNASTDDSVDMIDDEFYGVNIIRSKKNIGYAKANNRAIELSPQSDYVLLLNPDVILNSNAIKTIRDYMLNDKSVGICGPKVLLADGTLDRPCKRSFKTPTIYLYHTLGLSKVFPKSRRFGKYYLSYLNDNETHEVDSIIGAFLMIRKETISEIGLLDTNFYVYGEDEDWCYRAKKAGWKVIYNPAAEILHLKGSSTSKRKVPMIYAWHRAAYLFHKKNLAKTYHYAINYLVYAGIGIHLIASLFLNSLLLGKNIFRGGDSEV